MDYDFTLSLHEGDSFSIEHDNREFISPNVQPEKCCQNIYYEGNVDIKKFYEETFQSAYEEHIKKQIKNGHGNRVKDWPKTYYEYIRKQQTEQEAIKQQMKLDNKHYKEIHQEDKYQRYAKQLIVQVGNIDDFENLSPDEQMKLHNQMKAILKEYMETFQTENPNFRIVNAVIHVDEMSLSPHLHLTYVPVAEVSRGQRVQNSLNSSLKAMGFVTDKEKDAEGVWLTAQMKWQAKERQRMVEIARRHGLRIGYQKGNRTQSKTIDDYRKARQEERIAEVEEKVKHLEQQAEHLERKSIETDFDIARKKRDANEQLEYAKQEMQDIKDTIASAERQIDVLDDMRANIKQTIDSAEKKFQDALVVEHSDTHPQYERITKGIGKNKKTYVVVPAEDFDKMDKVSYFNPVKIKVKVVSLFEDLRAAFSQLPAIKRLQQRVLQLENQNTRLQNELTAYKQKTDATIEQLKKENKSLHKENGEQQRGLQIFKTVLQTIAKRFNIKDAVNEEMRKHTHPEPSRGTVPKTNDEPNHDER